jgi:hypothetical protein
LFLWGVGETTYAEFQRLCNLRECAAFRLVGAVATVISFFEAQNYEHSLAALKDARAEYDAADRNTPNFSTRTRRHPPMATALQLSSEAAILGDLALPFASLGEELLGVFAQGFRLGAFFGPAGFHGLASGIGALLLCQVCRPRLSAAPSFFDEIFPSFLAECHPKHGSTFVGGTQELS